jgi:hypothetical protein
MRAELCFDVALDREGCKIDGSVTICENATFPAAEMSREGQHRFADTVIARIADEGDGFEFVGRHGEAFSTRAGVLCT